MHTKCILLIDLNKLANVRYGSIFDCKPVNREGCDPVNKRYVKIDSKDKSYTNVL